MQIFNDLDVMRDVSKNYAFLEEIFKYPSRDRIIKNSDKFIDNGRCFLTTISTTMSYLLGHSYEKCKNFNGKIIEEVLGQFSFWKQIQTTENMTSIEKFKQFRNCFEHANFLLMYDETVRQENTGKENYYIEDFNQVNYHFKNDKIEGEINFKELFILFRTCIDLFTKYNSKNSISMYIFDDRKGFTIKNKKNALDIIDNIIVSDINAGKNLLSGDVSIKIDNSKLGNGINNGAINNYLWDKNEFYQSPAASILNTVRIRNYINNKVDLGMNQISIVNRHATKEEKEMIYNYLALLTDNFTKPYSISNDFVNQLFSEHDLCFKAQDIFFGLFSQLHTKGLNKISLKTFQNFFWSKYDSSQYYDDIVALAPSLYATTLIASANYFLNYAYEVNKKMGSEIFKYKNINLEGIEIDNLTSDKLVKITDPLFSEKEEKTKLEKELLEMPSKLEWAERQKTILNNPKNKDPRKEDKLANINKFISTYDDEFKKLKDRYDYICTRIDSSLESEPYVDSNHLFRHLRNSISHGRFKINHDAGYKTKDFGNSIIELYDYDDETENVNVKIRMTLSRFEKLMKELSNNIYSQLDETRIIEISKRIAGLDLSDETTKSENKGIKMQ